MRQAQGPRPPLLSGDCNTEPKSMEAWGVAMVLAGSLADRHVLREAVAWRKQQLSLSENSKSLQRQESDPKRLAEQRAAG